MLRSCMLLILLQNCKHRFRNCSQRWFLVLLVSNWSGKLKFSARIFEIGLSRNRFIQTNSFFQGSLCWFFQPLDQDLPSCFGQFRNNRKRVGDRWENGRDVILIIPSRTWFAWHEVFATNSERMEQLKWNNTVIKINKNTLTSDYGSFT